MLFLLALYRVHTSPLYCPKAHPSQLSKYNPLLHNIYQRTWAKTSLPKRMLSSALVLKNLEFFLKLRFPLFVHRFFMLLLLCFYSWNLLWINLSYFSGTRLLYKVKFNFQMSHDLQVVCAKFLLDWTIIKLNAHLIKTKHICHKFWWILHLKIKIEICLLG